MAGKWTVNSFIKKFLNNSLGNKSSYSNMYVKKFEHCSILLNSVDDVPKIEAIRFHDGTTLYSNSTIRNSRRSTATIMELVQEVITEGVKNTFILLDDLNSLTNTEVCDITKAHLVTHPMLDCLLMEVENRSNILISSKYHIGPKAIPFWNLKSALIENRKYSRHYLKINGRMTDTQIPELSFFPLRGYYDNLRDAIDEVKENLWHNMLEGVKSLTYDEKMDHFIFPRWVVSLTTFTPPSVVELRQELGRFKLPVYRTSIPIKFISFDEPTSLRVPFLASKRSKVINYISYRGDMNGLINLEDIESHSKFKELKDCFDITGEECYIIEEYYVAMNKHLDTQRTLATLLIGQIDSSDLQRKPETAIKGFHVTQQYVYYKGDYMIKGRLNESDSNSSWYRVKEAPVKGE